MCSALDSKYSVDVNLCFHLQTLHNCYRSQVIVYWQPIRKKKRKLIVTLCMPSLALGEFIFGNARRVMLITHLRFSSPFSLSLSETFNET